MADDQKPKTKLLDELEKGPWPSFVKEIKQAGEKSPVCDDLLGQLELSYEEKKGHWKHGGIVGVLGYGGGVIGRYSDLPDKFPNVAHFHTMRVNQPAGWFYTSDAIRTLCDIWERHGSGLTNMHGSTGDIIFLGTKTSELEPAFKELTEAGFDLGGSGSAMRTPSCCVGPARCEWSCYDTLKTCDDLTRQYQDEMHRPPFPYKFKIKCSGCPNDCVASIARADLSIIGTWKDDIRQDDAAVAQYARAGLDIRKDVCDRCPTRCMEWDGQKLAINNRECVHCMHCINVMPKALRPGQERGATLLIGSKAPIVQGALLSSVLVPFVPENELMDTLKELIRRIWEFWDEYGNNRERVGELIQRVGMANFLDAIGLDPAPEMVAAPRDNPYIFFQKEEAAAEPEPAGA
ncbi:MAG: dissimilatory-type sulfite reductase subunit alpha [Acidobacteria bacterium]|jgi:sulfite reductase alpha subunit|nr:dissimilatory-type sulfite reductase subunit alpha [Acidobacteriota bacterium]